VIDVAFVNSLTGSVKVLRRSFDSEGEFLQWLASVRPMVELVSVRGVPCTDATGVTQ
jgi:hypothetical protein